MMRPWGVLAVVAVATVILSPVFAAAKQAEGRRDLHITVRPKASATHRWRGYGFLPGYRQPPPLTEWRDRAPRYGGGDFTDPRRRYWSGGEWRYGWGGPGFYRGRWNGGGFGPCWTQTPIGPMWNCGM